MYLSRFLLNPRSYEVRRDLGGYQEMHRRVLSMFPPVPPGAGDVEARRYFRILHRVETDRQQGPITLLVQSGPPPDWSRLPDGYCLQLAGIENPQSKCIDEQYAALHAGQRLAFRLRANPTRVDPRTCTEGRRRGKRVDLRGEEQWLRWLWRKGQMAGFGLISIETGRLLERAPQLPGNVPAVRVTAQSRQWGRREAMQAASRDSRGNPLIFASVLFEGMLEITEANRFRQALVEGIGSGKAYGFGLLSIAPLRSMAQ
jgi:CRISPR system Cascade subunit CasE